jgi:hypothetical protein
MPLPKRILIHNADLANPDQLLENESPIDLPTANFSRLLGTMKKLTMLSAIAMETFSNLSVMLEDINERASIVANRTDSAVKKLVEVEKGMRRLELQPESNVISYSQKYFKKRQVTIPPLFIKASNYSAVKAQYKLCREPPQLWRLENIVGDDLFQFFSFPGYFFQEWLRAELFKQERAKLLRRANKALKKLQKKEKKRKLMESQKIRTKSFIGRPTSMKLLDKTSPRPSQLGAGSVASADQALAPPVSVKTHFTSIAADDAKNAAAPGRPVSTAAAKLFADSPEPDADDAGATATAAEAPQVRPLPAICPSPRPSGHRLCPVPRRRRGRAACRRSSASSARTRTPRPAPAAPPPSPHPAPATSRALRLLSLMTQWRRRTRSGTRRRWRATRRRRRGRRR